MNNQLEEVVYWYICKDCKKDIQITNPDFDKTNKCFNCGGEYSAPTMYFNEKLIRPIQSPTKK